MTQFLQADTSDQVSSLIKGGWPLDSYIFDMQWHRTPSWGGYEWDDQRYSNVTAMLASMHDIGLYTGMNLHDVARPPYDDPSNYSSAGVVAADNPNSWPAFAAAMGFDPSAKSIDFDIGNRTYAVALHELLVTPLLQQGLDMCWCSPTMTRAPLIHDASAA
jgi:alpha-glucosidase (family GH31 glycosyl hydrolase)